MKVFLLQIYSSLGSCWITDNVYKFRNVAKISEEWRKGQGFKTRIKSTEVIELKLKKGN